MLELGDSAYIPMLKQLIERGRLPGTRSNPKPCCVILENTPVKAEWPCNVTSTGMAHNVTHFRSSSMADTSLPERSLSRPCLPQCCEGRTWWLMLTFMPQVQTYNINLIAIFLQRERECVCLYVLLPKACLHTHLSYVVKTSIFSFKKRMLPTVNRLRTHIFLCMIVQVYSRVLEYGMTALRRDGQRQPEYVFAYVSFGRCGEMC